MTSTAERPGYQGRSSRARRPIDQAAWSRFAEPIILDKVGITAWRPEIVDAGFGTGATVVELATQEPTTRVLGVEMYETGVLRAARSLAQLDPAPSVRLSTLDIRAVLPVIAPGSLREFRLFFPDPWPKRRHALRRLVDPGFLDLVVSRLCVGGLVWMATDADHYAADVTAYAAARPALLRLPAPPAPRPVTRYESIAQRAGRSCHDLVWQRA